MSDVAVWIQSLRASAGEAGSEVRIPGDDLRRLLDLAEKGLAVADQAKSLLANAFSMPGDDQGLRFLSQDAVKLQWALRELEGGEDADGGSFGV